MRARRAMCIGETVRELHADCTQRSVDALGLHGFDQTGIEDDRFEGGIVHDHGEDDFGLATASEGVSAAFAPSVCELLRILRCPIPNRELVAGIQRGGEQRLCPSFPVQEKQFAFFRLSYC